MSETRLPPFKRGDTYLQRLQYRPGNVAANLDTITIRVHFRTSTRTLVAASDGVSPALIVTKDATQSTEDTVNNTGKGWFTIECDKTLTATWSLGDLWFDVEFVDSLGRRRSSVTMVFAVAEDITR